MHTFNDDTMHFTVHDNCFLHLCLHVGFHDLLNLGSGTESWFGVPIG